MSASERVSRRRRSPSGGCGARTYYDEITMLIKIYFYGDNIHHPRIKRQLLPHSAHSRSPAGCLRSAPGPPSCGPNKSRRAHLGNAPSIRAQSRLKPPPRPPRTRSIFGSGCVCVWRALICGFRRRRKFSAFLIKCTSDVTYKFSIT